ncbi:MAG: lysophospholipid acyltransferase family protein [Bacillota bacterium]|nr:lysophospholipid acyltransferase family protein [Bacillota bacterium]
MFFNFAYSLLRVVFFPFYRLKITGRENLPESGGMLVCANHTCLKDPIFVAFALGIKHDYAFMAKSELFNNALFGFILKRLGAFPVNRAVADVRAVKTAIHSLRDGKTLILFPEGTRRKDAVVKAGAGMLAVRSGVPVVPVYIGGKKRIFCRTEIRIGKPFKLESPARPDYNEAASEIMQKVRGLSLDGAL